MQRRNWTRDETILAFSLYCQLDFSKIDKSNPNIVKMAQTINRTPSSVAMKLSNFASLDPFHQMRGVKGLSNASKMDKLIWEEFHNNLDYLEEQVIAVPGALYRNDDEYDNKANYDLPEGYVYERMAEVRGNQNLFRKAVLTAYNHKCCITGLGMDQILIASHIKPWAISDPKTERTNPRNGLCLNALHDKAYDQGLITVDRDYKIVLSNELKDFCSSQEVSDYFMRYEGESIQLPNRFLPDREYLTYHCNNIFLG